jgi:hypothetical protein
MRHERFDYQRLFNNCGCAQFIACLIRIILEDPKMFAIFAFDSAGLD